MIKKKTRASVEIKRNFCIDHLVISISISRWCSSIFIHGFPSAPLPTALPNPTTTATNQTLQVFIIILLSIFLKSKAFPFLSTLHFTNTFDIFYFYFYLQFHLLCLFIYCFLLLSEICKQSMVRCHSRWRFTTLLICKISPSTHPIYLPVCKFFIFSFLLFSFGPFIFSCMCLKLWKILTL